MTNKATKSQNQDNLITVTKKYKYEKEIHTHSRFTTVDSYEICPVFVTSKGGKPI